jgi:PadR family transcriptional regulator, regulatory protein PadR
MHRSSSPLAHVVCFFYYSKQMRRRDESLGSVEHIVLLAVMRLGKEAYGITVLREIESIAGRNLSIGTVYATLWRLESKGFVKTSAGEPTAERGGRAKQYFRVTADGKSAVIKAQESILKMSSGIKDLLVGK